MDIGGKVVIRGSLYIFNYLRAMLIYLDEVWAQVEMERLRPCGTQSSSEKKS